jgi:hypothetical protein
MIYILNSPVLTTYGHYNFSGPITVAKARNLLQSEFVSAIGHASTAELLSVLLDISIPINRVRIEMQPGDKALVFRLLERVEEGRVFSREEVEKLPFELGVLERINLGD